MPKICCAINGPEWKRRRKNTKLNWKNLQSQSLIWLEKIFSNTLCLFLFNLSFAWKSCCDHGDSFLFILIKSYFLNLLQRNYKFVRILTFSCQNLAKILPRFFKFHFNGTYQTVWSAWQVRRCWQCWAAVWLQWLLKWGIGQGWGRGGNWSSLFDQSDRPLLSCRCQSDDTTA